MLSWVRDWSSGRPFGLPGVTRLNAALALLLSVGVVLSASGAFARTNPQGDVWVCLAALPMTLPVAWRRDAPLAAIATLAGGALFNWLVVGSYVRCGATLPALFLCLYSVADRRALRPALLGAGLGLVSGIAQAHSDPQLKGFTLGACVFTVLLWTAGRLARSRQGMVETLRTRNDELRAQRDRTAAVAVTADRARLAERLDGEIGQRIGRLAADAASAEAALAEQPQAAGASLAAIEQEGRRTLSQMREMVGALRDTQPVEPQPTLADLEALLARLGPGRSRLTIEGDPARLPAGVELSAFRIIERLLEPLEGAPDAQVAVALRYTPDELELRIRGPVRPGVELRTPLATAREWAALNAGQLESELRSGISTTSVRLPLVSAHA